MAEEGKQGPKLQIDADWKASAQAEKARLSEQERSRESRRADPGLPKATFSTLIDMLASQAIMSLGAMADPKTGRVIVDPAGAKFSIDLLVVLEDKSKNNLSQEEADHLKHLLTELRARFVQVMQLVEAHGGGAHADEFEDGDDDTAAPDEAGNAPAAAVEPKEQPKSKIIIEE